MTLLLTLDDGSVQRKLADAVEFARAAVLDETPEEQIGTHVGVSREDAVTASHLFEAQVPGYRGWRWCVTVALAGDDEPVTVSEVVLVPGPSALVAPAWVPWERRVRAGDLGVGDIFPTDENDPRLVPAYLQSDDPAVEEVSRDAGLGRVHVLSRFGRTEAASRWHGGEFGPRSDMARSAPDVCGTCGFFVPLAGSLRGVFGVCSNDIAPADGHVVDVEYGCGAHSEVEVEVTSSVPVAELVYDDSLLDFTPVPSPSGVVETAAAEAETAIAEADVSPAEVEPETVTEAAGVVAEPVVAEAEPVAAEQSGTVEPVAADAEPAQVEAAGVVAEPVAAEAAESALAEPADVVAEPQTPEAEPAQTDAAGVIAEPVAAEPEAAQVEVAGAVAEPVEAEGEATDAAAERVAAESAPADVVAEAEPAQTEPTRAEVTDVTAGAELADSAQVTAADTEVAEPVESDSAQVETATTEGEATDAVATAQAEPADVVAEPQAAAAEPADEPVVTDAEQAQPERSEVAAEAAAVTEPA
jgi:hypothetical protein